MKCCSRSTLGVVIGGISVLFYVGCAAFVIALISYSNSSIKANKPSTIFQNVETVDDNWNTIRRHDVVETYPATSTLLLSTMLSVFLVMSIISGLLIVGIVKRRHKLMWPWLALSGIAFVCGCFRIFFSVIVGLTNDLGIQGVLMQFMADVLAAGLQALILWPIFTLCRDIMRKNTEKPGQVIDGVQYSYVAPDAPPQYLYYNSGLPQKS